MVRKEKIKVIFIDYIQLVRGPKHMDKKNYEVGYVSETLKMMAKELNVAVVALAQMSRSFEGQDRRPRLSDLKDSGNLEQDADVVGFLTPHNPEEAKEANIVPVRLDLAKVREGESGSMCDLTFFKEFTLFETAARFPDTN
jgi:replicative DNA helicase